jgi:cytochrome c553
MQARRSKHRLAVSLAAAALLSLGTQEVVPGDFEERLARVDDALEKNPGKVAPLALDSCLRRRNSAVQLQAWGETARAERSLKYCFQVLHVSEPPVRQPEERAAASIAEVQAKAARELEQALALVPDLAAGLEIYRGCAQCHMPEGWGLRSGLVPQLAGQHRTVVIKQLADIRAGNREAVAMAPYATVELIGGVQAVADVAGYIDTLEISTAGGKGPGDQLELGARLYREMCARCHGAAGEGDADSFVPRIQAQHYLYLVQQFEAIRDRKRRNAHAEMTAQIEGIDEKQMSAVLDYVSRLEPPPELQAPPGWSNPDFAR